MDTSSLSRHLWTRTCGCGAVFDLPTLRSPNAECVACARKRGDQLRADLTPAWARERLRRAGTPSGRPAQQRMDVRPKWEPFGRRYGAVECAEMPDGLALVAGRPDDPKEGPVRWALLDGGTHLGARPLHEGTANSEADARAMAYTAWLSFEPLTALAQRQEQTRPQVKTPPPHGPHAALFEGLDPLCEPYSAYARKRFGDDYCEWSGVEPRVGDVILHHLSGVFGAVRAVHAEQLQQRLVVGGYRFDTDLRDESEFRFLVDAIELRQNALRIWRKGEAPRNTGTLERAMSNLVWQGFSQRDRDRIVDEALRLGCKLTPQTAWQAAYRLGMIAAPRKSSEYDDYVCRVFGDGHELAEGPAQAGDVVRFVCPRGDPLFGVVQRVMVMGTLSVVTEPSSGVWNVVSTTHTWRRRSIHVGPMGGTS